MAKNEIAEQKASTALAIMSDLEAGLSPISRPPLARTRRRFPLLRALGLRAGPAGAPCSSGPPLGESSG